MTLGVALAWFGCGFACAPFGSLLLRLLKLQLTQTMVFGYGILMLLDGLLYGAWTFASERHHVHVLLACLLLHPQLSETISGLRLLLDRDVTNPWCAYATWVWLGIFFLPVRTSWTILKNAVLPFHHSYSMFSVHALLVLMTSGGLVVTLVHVLLCDMAPSSFDLNRQCCSRLSRIASGVVVHTMKLEGILASDVTHSELFDDWKSTTSTFGDVASRPSKSLLLPCAGRSVDEHSAHRCASLVVIRGLTTNSLSTFFDLLLMLFLQQIHSSVTLFLGTKMVSEVI